MKPGRVLAVFTLVLVLAAAAYAATRRSEPPPPTSAAGISSLVPGSLLQAAPAFQVGPSDAPIVLEEYSDYECPYCARSFLRTGEQVMAFVERRGNLRYAFYDLEGPTHYNALGAATAARCAGAQGRYPEAQHLLFERQADWSTRNPQRADPVELVGALVPDGAAYQTCTADLARVAEVLAANLERALTKGVQSTPTLVLIAGDSVILLRGVVDSARIAAAIR